jgi:hypothetical protein
MVIINQVEKKLGKISYMRRRKCKAGYKKKLPLGEAAT